MKCVMCFNTDCSLLRLQTCVDNNTLKEITFILPDFEIPNTPDPVFVCITCQKQVAAYYEIKKASLKNSYHLNLYKSVLKATSEEKINELKIILNNNNQAAIYKQDITFKININLFKDEDQCIEKDSNSTSFGVESQEQHVNKERRFQCCECDKAFIKASHLLAHTRVHSGDKPYQCQTCSKAYTQSGSLKKHMLVHTGPNALDAINYKKETKIDVTNEHGQYQCTYCEKAFTQRSNLVCHIRTHTGEKPFKCPECQKAFTQSSDLTRHRLTHTAERPHECDICHKAYTQKSHLRTHILGHSNVRPHRCTVCNKAFTQSGHLSQHMRTHTGQKPHQCQFCEYKCSHAGALKTHIRYHTGEKPFKCTLCLKSFTSSSSLNDHKRRLHKS